MADFERRQLEIRLEFVRWSFDERNNFSQGSSKTNKDAQVIRVRGAADPRVFSTRITFFNQGSYNYNIKTSNSTKKTRGAAAPTLELLGHLS